MCNSVNHIKLLIISFSLFKAFQTRLRQIMDSSMNSYNKDTSDLTAKLDEIERTVFQSGQIGLADFQRWERRQTEKLTSSDMVSNHRKRKRALMESNS